MSIHHNCEADKKSLADQLYAKLVEIRELKTEIVALNKIIVAARNVDDNDGADEGWKLRYALRKYDAGISNE